MREDRREDGTYSGLVTKILDTCGMAPKYIPIAGEQGQKEEEMLRGAMLGVGYDYGSARMAFCNPQFFTKRGEGGTKENVHFSVRELEALRNGQGSLLLCITLSYVIGHD